MRTNTIQPVIEQVLQRFDIKQTVNADQFTSVVDLFLSSVERFGDKPAVTSLGRTLSYRQLSDLSHQFAAYLQHHTPLRPGDRIAIQLPNLLQYPVALFGSLLAGLVVVNTNPLYSERELEHQLQDSGAKALVVFAPVANKAADILARTDVKTVVVTELGDLQTTWRRWALNFYARSIKKMVPEFSIPGALTLMQAMELGAHSDCDPPSLAGDDYAVLQYTGGTTGVAKGAILTHRNLVANTLQCTQMFGTYGLVDGEETFLLPLPLYHIYTFTMMMIMVLSGNHSVLIPDPRNIKALVNTIYRYGMSVFCGINTLFVALCQNEKFQRYDFSTLKETLSGGMALTSDAAQQWLKVTGHEIYQGYGLTEASPVVAVNPGGGNQQDSIGVAIPGTEVAILGEDDNWLGVGERGELCIRGPQVMQGYWRRPDETARVLDADGWLRTGDIAIVAADGFLRIVDRKKDMIVVSGFKVFPNELEEVLSEHPDVLESAAIGIPDPHSGEAVKMFVVSSRPGLNAAELKAFCAERLTGYKIPKQFEFVDELPKSNVGKVLRRQLRDRS